jgi:hypothetical protein
LGLTQAIYFKPFIFIYIFFLVMAKKERNEKGEKEGEEVKKSKRPTGKSFIKHC